VLFRAFFYVGKCTVIAFLLLFVFVFGRSLLENVFGVEFGPVAENVLLVLFLTDTAVLIAGFGFLAACAVYLLIVSRLWEFACPYCGAKGKYENDDATNILMACPNCGVVGGRIFWDWSIGVYPPGNPTRAWRREAGFPLVVDLDAETFCGVRFGGDTAPLRALGPVEFAPGLTIGAYMYFSRGLEYLAEGDVLLSCSVYEADSDDPRFASFPGHLKYGGELRSLSQMNQQRALELFGEPFKREASDGIVCWYYERAGIAFDLEFSRDGRFGMFSASAKVSS